MKTIKYLLFDDQYTEHKTGFKTTVNPPTTVKYPLLTADQPWERAGLAGDSCITVLKEDGIYKMWYCIASPEPEKGKSRDLTPAEKENLNLHNVPKKFMADILCPSRYFLCYATSTNGINWKKGKLGIYEFDGNKGNNIVFSGRIGATVFIDPTAPLDKKYKMIHGGSLRLPHWLKMQNKFVRMAYTGIFGAYSADGVHWTNIDKQIIPWYTDTTNVCYWDNAIKKYVAYVRKDKDMVFENGKTLMLGQGHNTYRIIGRTESNDFKKFPPPATVLEPEPQEVEDYFADGNCNRGLDFYNSAAIKYPFAEDCYFMFPSYFYHEPDILDVHIATSRDGINYTRQDEAIIGLKAFTDFNAGQLYMATGMVEENKHIHMYCLAYNTGHDYDSKHNDRKALVGRVSFRKDGFVSQKVSDRGEYTTVPIRIPDGCNCIKVNMEAAENGYMRFALMNPNGKILPGRSLDDSDTVTGNHHCIKMSWKGNCDLKDLQGQDIKIKFAGEYVKLYSFELAPDKLNQII